MKTTDHFKETIKKHLDERAEKDTLFAETYKKEEKNIDDCCTYILNEVQKSGCNGFTDDEIYSMAVHYYDEDSIDIGKKIDPGRIVINHVVKLTDEEKEEARVKASKEYQEELMAEMRKKNTRPQRKKKEEPVEQPSLFDL